MNVYMTEEEQVEQLKKWWSQYGNLVLTIILAIILCFQGYRWYDNKQLETKEQASVAFNSLMDVVSKGDKSGIQAKANFIKDTYPATVYASSASLILAKQYVDAKQYPKAKQALQWVITDGASSRLKQLARLRLARIELFEKHYQQALAQLAKIEDSVFKALVFEARGDVYLAQGNKQEANAQYQLALTNLPNPALAPADLRIKLNHVANQTSQLVSQTITSSQKHSG